MEPQPVGSQPTNNYDFILNPQKPTKHKLLGGLGGGSFITKVMFIVGGAIVLMVVTAVLVNVFFGGKNNLESLVALTKTEQELARLGAEGKEAGSQEVKNSAINTVLVVTSHQKSWLAFISKHGRTVKSEELKLSRDTSSDKQLATAKQTSTFDTIYTTLMRSGLTDYAKAIKNAHQSTANKQERDMLDNQYKDVQLLLEQWP